MDTSTPRQWPLEVTLVMSRRYVTFFTNLGKKPFYQRLDNETSVALESFFKAEKISIQYCPPGQHRANNAERSIQTFKNHLISTLATTDPTFPLKLWDRLLPQVELCVNHLLPYKPNPTISAYAGTHGGSHNFRAHPIAPAGIKVLVHDKPSWRASWAPHGVPGYYLGPALQHYRCYHVYIPSTSTTRITDTVQWFPHGFLMPDPSPHDNTIAALADLSTALQQLTSLPPAARNDPALATPHTITDQLRDLILMYSPQQSPLDPTHQSLLTPVPSAPAPPPEQRVPDKASPPSYALATTTDTALIPPTDTLPSPAPYLDPVPKKRVHFLTPVTLPVDPPSTLPSSTPSLPPLNLAPDGSPLTYRT